jgi:CheY-like chemotaxis protein
MARVLVIDDDPGTLETFGLILRYAGHIPSLAASCKEGLTLAASQPLDLILADLRLPESSGLEFIAEAHVQCITAPVVIITAFGTRAARFASQQLGAVDFAEKPIDQDLLLNLVRTHADTHDPLYKRRLTSSNIDNETHHAALRWASVVLPIVNSAHDLPTVESWSREVGRSQATLKRWCSIADVHASDSLDFGRALRIVRRYAGHRCRWYDALAIAEPATLVRFMRQAGFSKDLDVPHLDEFIAQQHFIKDPILLRAIMMAQ